MRQIITLILVLTPFFVNAQKTISTPYFNFKCNCTEIENQYNSKNKSNNYTYAIDDKTLYMYSVKRNNDNKAGQDTFLDAIRDSGVSEYKNIVFKGVKAITTTRILQSGNQKGHSRDLLFFKGNNLYSIIIVAENTTKLETMFNNLKLTFNTK